MAAMGRGSVISTPRMPTAFPTKRVAGRTSATEIWKDNGWPLEFDNETLPPSLYAIEPPAPSWLYDNEAFSRGYLDDACDGFVEVRLTRRGEDPDKSSLTAKARICSGPPAMAPDSLFVRPSPMIWIRSCSARRSPGTRTLKSPGRGAPGHRQARLRDGPFHEPRGV